MTFRSNFLAVAAIAFISFAVVRCSVASGRLELSAVDADTGQPVAVRMYLKNAQGRPAKPAKLPGALAWGDSIVFYDKVRLDLPNGGYQFTMERGPEYRLMTGTFEINNFADDTKSVQMHRFCDMSKEGWYSGDLDVNCPAKDLQLAMQADDVRFVPLVTWSNKKNPWAKQPLPKQTIQTFGAGYIESVIGGELSSPGNTLRVFRLDKPLDLTVDTKTADANAAGSPPTAAALGSLPWIPIVAEARRNDHAWIDAGAFSRVTCPSGSPPAKSIRCNWPTAICCAKESSPTKPAAGRATWHYIPIHKATAAGTKTSITIC